MRVTKLWKIGNSVVCTIDVATLLKCDIKVGDLVKVFVMEKGKIMIERAVFELSDTKRKEK